MDLIEQQRDDARPMESDVQASMTNDVPEPVVGFLEVLTERHLAGWAFRPRGTRPLVLHVYVDGLFIAEVPCERPRDDVWRTRTDVQEGNIAGQHVGFHVPFPQSLYDDATHDVTFTDDEGNAVHLQGLVGGKPQSWQIKLPAISVDGRVQLAKNGEAVNGWAVQFDRAHGETRVGLTVLVFNAGGMIGKLTADGSRPDVAKVTGADARCGFTFKLPRELLDGGDRELRFGILETGQEIPGSPIKLAGGRRRAKSGEIAVESRTGVEPAEIALLIAMFDQEHYATVTGLSFNEPNSALQHFLTAGLYAGHPPTPLFDPALYTERATEAKQPPSGTDQIFMHWLRHGRVAQIVPTAYFDAEFYAKAAGNDLPPGVFGFEHYLTVGNRHSQAPNAWFDPAFYWKSCQATTGLGGGFAHFLTVGAKSGLQPNPLLSGTRYARRTLKEWEEHGPAFMAAYKAFTLAYWPSLFRDLAMIYQHTWYVVHAGLPQDTSVLAALTHLLSEGMQAGLLPMPFFNADEYRRLMAAEASDVQTDDEPLLMQWLRNPRRPRLIPTRLFSERLYRATWADMADPSIDAFWHYITNGLDEGRQPNLWFEPLWFKRYSDAAPPQTGSYLAFLMCDDLSAGSRALSLLLAEEPRPDWSDPAPAAALRQDITDLVAAAEPWLAELMPDQMRLALLFFAPESYTGAGTLAPDTSVVVKIAHFLHHGMAIGMEVGPLFSAETYIRRAELAGLPPGAEEAPFVHFLRHGVQQRVVPTQAFDTETYLRLNPDLRNFPNWLFLHYVGDGLYEGRSCSTKQGISLAPTETASARLIRWRLIAEAGTLPLEGLPKDIRWVVSAQQNLSRFAASAEFSALVQQAQFHEPLVGETDARRDLLAAPLHDQGGRRILAICKSLPSAHYDYIICIPWLRSGGADLVSGFVARAVREQFPNSKVLVLQTDAPNIERRDWIPDDVDVVDISKAAQPLSIPQRELMLFTLIRGTGAKAVLNVNSRLCWTTIQRFGERLKPITKLVSYLFCWDYSRTGLRVGYPSEFFAATHSNLTATLTDTEFLRNELVRMYALPEDMAGRVWAIPSPTLLEACTPTMAELGAMTGVVRQRPVILWGSRLDRQKRFDLVIEIARRLPDYDFLCWGSAMLDAGPDLSTLPPNITMKGNFASMAELPLETSDGWLFTSAWEGMPTTILELGIRGMPIVASSVGGIPEMIDETTGWLVAPFDDIQAYVDALRALIASPAERVARGRRLQARVQQRHNFSVYGRTLRAALQEV